MKHDPADIQQLETITLPGFRKYGAQGYIESTELPRNPTLDEPYLAGLDGRIVPTPKEGGDMDIVDVLRKSMFGA